MKKLLKINVLLLLLSTFCFVSCDDDDTGGGDPLLPAKNLVATPGDAQVVLKWEAPASDNLKEYNVTWTPGDGNIKVAKGTTTYTATGLTNGTSYSFSVYAVYTNGRSDAITAQNITPKAETINYSPVTDLKAAAGDKSIEVSWTKPAAVEKATLAGYTIAVTPKDIEPVTIDDPDVTSYLLTGLTNGKEYTVGVTATYTDKGRSAEVSAVAKPTSAIVGVTVEGANHVALDEESHTIEVYYNWNADLTNVQLNLDLAEGVTIETPQTFDLSGGKTGEIVVNDKLTYTVKATIDLLITGLTASYNDQEGLVALNNSASTPTVEIDFEQKEIDKKAISVNMTLSENATLVNPTENPATMDLSADTKITLKGKYGNTVEYAVTCKGGVQIVPLFNPAEITGAAIPADWERVTSFNNADLPKSMAVYKIKEYNGATIDAYMVMWGKEAAHTVYGNGEQQPFADLKGLSDADAPAVLIAGDASAGSYSVHNGQLLHYKGALDSEKPEDTAPCFALNNDGSWLQASGIAITENSVPTFANWDTGRTKWDAKEAFGCGGLFLNPAAGGGFTSNGETENFSQCFFGVDNSADGKVAAFFLCNKGGQAEGMTQDDVCRMLISVGIKQGFPVCREDAVGLYMNGEEVFQSNGTPRFAVGIK